MIRVLQVFTVMDRGGAESMIMNYYRNIDRSKVQFDFLVHRAKVGAFENEILELGGKIFKLPPINPVFPFLYFKELREFFRCHHEYSIVHSHLNTFSIFPLKIAKEFKVPTRIAHAHIAIEPIKISALFNSDEGVKESLKKVLKSFLKKRVKKYATHQFACGKMAGDWLFGKSSSYLLVNNAIDTNEFIFNQKIREKLTKEMKLENKFVLGHVGRFTSQKNHFFLLQILRDLVQQKKETELLMIGDGPLKSKILDEIVKLNLEKHVRLLGIRKDVNILLQCMDVFVFPSFYEGLPVTLIEAQASGLKVLASKTITNEVQLTDNFEFLSITSTKPWVKSLLSPELRVRSNTRSEIEKGGYDIKANALFLQNFYLDKVKLN